MIQEVAAEGTTEETVRGRLLEDLRELIAELGHPERAAAAMAAEWPPLSMPDIEDRRLLTSFRAALAGLLPDRQPEAAEREVRALLDGAQLSARSEILAGEIEELRRLFAGIAYLLVLAVSGPAEAMRVARLAAERLDGSAVAVQVGE